MKPFAALALAMVAGAAPAAEVRVITPASHSLFPTAPSAADGAPSAADASALKPAVRALPSPILVERRVRVDADGAIVYSCSGTDRRDFRQAIAKTRVAQ